MHENLEKFLSETYYNINNPDSFSSIKVLLKSAIQNGFEKVTEKDIKLFLKKQEIYTRFKIPIKKFKRRQLQSWGLDTLWQGDLLSLQKFPRQNKGIKYLFNIIDVFSRFCFLLPIKNKTAIATRNAFKNLIENTGRKPMSIQLDRGNEFGGEFAKLCEHEGIRIVPAFGPLKAALAENLNKRVANKLYKWMHINKTKSWLGIIKIVANDLNSTYINSIGCEPVSVNVIRQNAIYNRLYKNKKIKKRFENIFKIGDRVRIMETTNIFTKSFKPHFSQEIFTVVTIFKGDPNLYIVADSSGYKIAKRLFLKLLLKNSKINYFSFYSFQLQETE